MSRTHIIVVNYNTGDWLTRSLSAALAHAEGTISVIDNDSTDASFQNARTALGSNPRVSWIENSSNLGFAAANNMVLANLKEEFAVLLNPDCELKSGTLPTILSYFDQHPDMALASCCIYNEDGSLQPTCKRRFPTPRSALVRLAGARRVFPNMANFDYGDVDPKMTGIDFVEAVSGAFMVVRKQAIEQVGVMDADYFMHCEDLDWCKRFELAGWKVGFVNEVGVIHAKGVSSASRPLRVQWSLHRGMSRFFDKFYNDQYSLLTRLLVKIGIAMNFIWRSLLSVVRR